MAESAPVEAPVAAPAAVGAAAPVAARAAAPVAARAHRKERVGEVVSDKMDKTIVVRVERRFRHPRYKKVVTAFAKFYAHDEKDLAKIGDRVRIVETRPLSRLKRWRLVEILERGADSPVAAS
jgi:small subunit ribosomal protein S17